MNTLWTKINGPRSIIEVAIILMSTKYLILSYEQHILHFFGVYGLLDAYLDGGNMNIGSAMVLFFFSGLH